METLNNRKNKIDDIDGEIEFKMNNISVTGSSLLGSNQETANLFSKDNQSYQDYVVITVNLLRATLKEASSFKGLLENTISNDEKSIIVDMNSCEFVDSSFLGVLVAGLKRIGRMGLKLVIVHNSHDRLPIFSATGLDKIFKVFSTVDEATES